jgi:DNA-3-methyladenine glycosylase
VREDGYKVSEVRVTPRIGINRAIDWPLRFTLPGHPCVSGPRRFEGSCIFLADNDNSVR